MPPAASLSLVAAPTVRPSGAEPAPEATQQGNQSPKRGDRSQPGTTGFEGLLAILAFPAHAAVAPAASVRATSAEATSSQPAKQPEEPDAAPGDGPKPEPAKSMAGKLGKLSRPDLSARQAEGGDPLAADPAESLATPRDNRQATLNAPAQPATSLTGQAVTDGWSAAPLMSSGHFTQPETFAPSAPAGQAIDSRQTLESSMNAEEAARGENSVRSGVAVTFTAMTAGQKVASIPSKDRTTGTATDEQASVTPPASGAASLAPAAMQGIGASSTPTSANASPGQQLATSAPVTAQVLHGILERADASTGKGRSEFRIQLSPPDLGSVQVHLTAMDHAVTARLVVTSDASQRALESGWQILQQKLGESGIRLVSFDVSQQGQRGSQGGQQTPDEALPLAQANRASTRTGRQPGSTPAGLTGKIDLVA